MDIELKLAYEETEYVRRLIEEYMQMLVRMEPDIETYLRMQNSEEELRNLKEKYKKPDGRLYLAYVEGIPVGCIGLRRLKGRECEMKRLYVRTEFRGMHIGDVLVKKIISDARDIGYRTMRLDTFPFLERAIGLYRKYGFSETPSYNDNPLENAVYMKLDL